jgi:NADH:ubiquinone oxidoreductase subunit 3 (subunit A)
MTNHPYIPVIVLLLGGLGFAVGTLALAWVWAKIYSPKKSGQSKNAIYECGLESSGDAWIKFKPGYYLYAIIFLIFDVEAVFLLPFAVAFGGFSAAQAVDMLVFIL